MENLQPQRRYLELLRHLFADSGRGLTKDLFSRYTNELQVIFINEFGKILPDVHHDLCDGFIQKIREMLSVSGDCISIAMMPAGGFAVWLARKIQSENLKIVAYLDNFKPEGVGADGLPVCRPEAAAGLPIDAVLLATPSVSAQYNMANQIQGIVNPNVDIVLSALAALEMKVDSADEQSQQRAEQAAKEYTHAVKEAGGNSILCRSGFPGPLYRYR